MGITLGEKGEIADVMVTPSLVKVGVRFFFQAFALQPSSLLFFWYIFMFALCVPAQILGAFYPQQPSGQAVVTGVFHLSPLCTCLHLIAHRVQPF